MRIREGWSEGLLESASKSDIRAVNPHPALSRRTGRGYNAATEWRSLRGGGLRGVHLLDHLVDLIAVEVRRDGLVLVGQQVVHGGPLGGDAVSGDLDVGDPCDGVEDGLAEIILGPVPMDVPAGTAEAAAVVIARG